MERKTASIDDEIAVFPPKAREPDWDKALWQRVVSGETLVKKITWDVPRVATIRNLTIEAPDFLDISAFLASPLLLPRLTVPPWNDADEAPGDEKSESDESSDLDEEKEGLPSAEFMIGRFRNTIAFLSPTDCREFRVIITKATNGAADDNLKAYEEKAHEELNDTALDVQYVFIKQLGVRTASIVEETFDWRPAVHVVVRDVPGASFLASLTYRGLQSAGQVPWPNTEREELKQYLQREIYLAVRYQRRRRDYEEAQGFRSNLYKMVSDIRTVSKRFRHARHPYSTVVATCL